MTTDTQVLLERARAGVVRVPEPPRPGRWAVRARAEVPRERDWLSPGERAQLARWHFPKRRADWRVGRWAAKHALAECLRARGLHPALADMEILPASDGAPEARVSGVDLPLAISISHAGGLGFAVAYVGEVALGCDIERVEPRSVRFVQDYFTAAETRLVERAPEASRGFLATLLWSAKESGLKARRTGLRADTRTIEVRLAGDRPGGRCGLLTLRCVEPVQRLHGCWWVADGFVHTIVADEAACDPCEWCLGYHGTGEPGSTRD
jgi:phosphopantetheinyl transferase